MAITAPTLDLPQAQTRALPLPFEQANQTADQFGNSVGGMLATVGSRTAGDVAGYLVQEKARADQAVADEALNKLKVETQAQLDRLKAAQGFNATAVAQDAYAQLNKSSQKLWEGLANEEQRLAFARHGQEELFQAHRVGEAHVREQVESAENLSFKVANEGDVAFATRYGADVPGLLERRAAIIADRFERFGARRGMKPEDVAVLRDQELGKLYQAQVRVRLARSRFDEAQAILDQHEQKMGEEGTLLRAKVEEAQRNARADNAAVELLGANKYKDGTFNQRAAEDAADVKYPAGPERDAVRARIEHRAAIARTSRAAIEGQNWERAHLLYQGQSKDPASRSVLELQRRHPDAWADLTSDQRRALEHQERADKQAREGVPLTPEQERALASLENDIIDRPDKWAAEPESTLLTDKRYSILPERYRLQLMAKAAETKRDRNNPQSIVKSADEVMRAHAQRSGVLSSGTKGKAFDKWDEEDQARWTELREVVGPQVVAWYRDDKNKGKVIPPAVVEDFIDKARQSGRLQGTGFLGFFQTEMTRREADARPEAERQAQPFVPDRNETDEQVGRQVQYRRGLDPDKNPNAFTPDALARARSDWAAAQAGPPAKQRDFYVGILRDAGRPTEGPEAARAIQLMWEKDQLKLIR